MSLASLFGSSTKRIRYAIVGLGDISQQAMMPGIEATGNSTITALVTGDAEKAAQLASMYKVKNTYTYEQFEQLLNSGEIDALYLATPNWRHAEFILPALKSGIHVLCEKPLEISTALCQDILEAQQKSSAKLMVAYRLHFEPSTLALIEKLRAGEIGEPRYFSSVFSQMVDPKNHRAHNGALAGPLFDMGPYPINACRYVFSDEPTEVISATSIRYADSKLANTDDTIAVTLRFPRERIAQMVISYSSASINAFTVVGTEGSIELNPSFTYGEPMEQFIKVGTKQSHESFKATDQFGGEMKYFSNCILENREPEANAEEGYADVRVIEGILRAIESGKSVKLAPFTRATRIDPEAQVQKLAKSSPPKHEVNAAGPARS